MSDEKYGIGCDISEWDWTMNEQGSEAFCPRCGKAYEDFSDLGCGYCDRRSPEWGLE